MGFKEQLKIDNDNIFFNVDEFAEQALYNGVPVLIIHGQVETNMPGNTFVNKGLSDQFVCDIRKSDIPNPKNGDILTYEGLDYQFARIKGYDSGVFTLEFITGESVF